MLSSVEYIPEPSSDPTAYTISLGWNASELVRMMKGDSASLGGGTVSTVLIVDSAPLCESECTAVRCVLQFAAVTEDVLQCRKHFGQIAFRNQIMEKESRTRQRRP